MLVLTRKRGEMIVVGDSEITIAVVEIRGDRVRIGIDAPPDVSVHRKEVFDSIDELGGTSKAILRWKEE